jgi:hypothetical protein
MNLRESLLTAARDAPLQASTVDIDRIVLRERRIARVRRAGMGTAVLGTALLTALTVPALSGGQEPARGTAGPPAQSIEPAPATAAPLRLTAADLAAAVSDANSANAGTAQRQVPYVRLGVRVGGSAVDPDNPCQLRPGATAGRNGAPTAEDKCTKVEKDGHTAWIRRWGYSPKERPWTDADTVVIEVYFAQHDRPDSLLLANTDLPHPGAGIPSTPIPHGPKFEVSDAELSNFAVRLFPGNR